MTALNVVQQGSGPYLVLSHSLGSDLTMWDEVAAALSPHYTVVRYDHRGHGRSALPPGPCDVAALVEDAAGVILANARRPVHFAGISMGGMVAQAIAVRYPQMIRSIVVANSTNHYPEAARSAWRERIEAVKAKGVAAVVDGTMQRWFTAAFRADTLNGGAERVARVRRHFEATPPEGYLACAEAVAGVDLRSSNVLVHCPALVIAGRQDESTTEAMAREIALGVSGAQLRTLDTAHLSAVEQPLTFAKLVHDFIESA